MYIRIANILIEGRYGGPQARTIGVCEKLNDIGFESIVVFPRENADQFYEKLGKKKIQNRRISLHRLTKQSSHLIRFVIFFIPELSILYNLFKKEHIDIVHCNGAWQIKGIIAGKLSGARVVWFLNDTQMPGLLRMVFKILSLSCCDGLIANGHRAKKYYLDNSSLSQKPSIVIQSPVDTTVCDPDKVKEDQRITCFNGLKIITVGNINPVKGIEYFIKMSSMLNKQYKRLAFFVIGPHLGSQKKYSEKMLRLVENLELKNFYFYGPSDNIPSVLRTADVYVCSSIAEASPISVWEAMSMAKPIVSSDVGDVGRFIKDEENGFVVPVKDAAALAEKVGLLIEDEKMRKRFGQKAREVAVRCLDASICVKSHAKFYRKIMNSK
ncbi:MAG: hypothetical protein BBJ57_01195 [Desulfobacterales bacterium PC51MH44]|nr:MAG: hypothetical protein BBJ57_01195 [Desulfobacterales bacterium PC51MH44]